MKHLQKLLLVLLFLAIVISTLIGFYIGVPAFAEGVDKIADTIGYIAEIEPDTEKTIVPSPTPDTPEISVAEEPEYIPAEPVSTSEDDTYIVPTGDDFDVPDDLIIRTGYEPIDGDISIVPDDVADQLEEELETGPTGDGLTFDPLFYPYYSMLNDIQKHVYRQMYANANVPAIITRWAGSWASISAPG